MLVFEEIRHTIKDVLFSDLKTFLEDKDTIEDTYRYVSEQTVNANCLNVILWDGERLFYRDKFYLIVSDTEIKVCSFVKGKQMKRWLFKVDINNIKTVNRQCKLSDNYHTYSIDCHIFLSLMKNVLLEKSLSKNLSTKTKLFKI